MLRPPRLAPSWEVCLREVHAVCRPGDVVGEVGGVDGGEGGGVQHQEVGLLPLSVIPDGDQHPVILRGAAGPGQEVHLPHVVVLPVPDLASRQGAITNSAVNRSMVIIVS